MQVHGFLFARLWQRLFYRLRWRRNEAHRFGHLVTFPTVHTQRAILSRLFNQLMKDDTGLEIPKLYQEQ